MHLITLIGEIHGSLEMTDGPEIIAVSFIIYYQTLSVYLLQIFVCILYAEYKQKILLRFVQRYYICKNL